MTQTDLPNTEYDENSEDRGDRGSEIAPNPMSDRFAGAHDEDLRPVSKKAAALSGVLAAALALGVGELLSGFSNQVPSLVARVGDVVIENVPGSVERWAIATFGENDKPALVIGITVISLLIGAVTGIVSRTRPGAGWAVFGAFGVIGGLAAGSDPQRSQLLGWLAAAVAAVVGVYALKFLLRAARNATEAAEADVDIADPSAANRRGFLGAASAAAALGVATPLVGRSLRNRRLAQTEADRELVASAIEARPQAEPTDFSSEIADRVSAQGALIGDNFDDVDGITPVVVPNDEFYRIDTALVIPQLDVNTWSMKVTGMVDNEIELTFDDLLNMDPVEEYVTMSCVSNPIGGELVGNARWLGVPIKKVLDMAGVQAGADQIVGRSVDGWTGGFPTEYLDDPDRVALIAVAMNGEPLPVQHGFPVRLVVAGLYGYVSATKWLAEIELTTFEDFQGFWIPRGWSALGPVKTQSRIDVPRANSQIAPGPQVIAGIAWAPDRGIARVEVQTVEIRDGEPIEGPWIEADLSADVTDNSWRQWRADWDAPFGDYAIRVRATDNTGETQTEVRTRVDPDGATGWHTIAVRVA